MHNLMMPWENPEYSDTVQQLLWLRHCLGRGLTPGAGAVKALDEVIDAMIDDLVLETDREAGDNA